MSQFVATPYSLTFDLDSAPPESDQLVVHVYLYAPTRDTVCWVGNTAGGGFVDTKLEISVENLQPQTLGPNAGITLPSLLK